MKRKIRTLHIASFTGNLGDIANHTGTQNIRKRCSEYDFHITRKEMRQFYWRDWSFNSDAFVEEANSYDLLIIGGGNYFELWDEKSSTGCTIDLMPEYLNRIKTPILFYGLGFDLGQGYSEESVKKFKNFMDAIFSSERRFVSLRNDGAMKNMQTLFAERYDVHKVPDGGFFTCVKPQEHVEIKADCKNIAINLACDMPEIRFVNGYENFIRAFAAALQAIQTELQAQCNFIFVPHVFSDLKPAYDICNALEDRVRRTSVSVAPYLSRQAGHDYILSLYQKADLVLANRFHANVCAFALNVNVMGLANYSQIELLYQELKSEEVVNIKNIGFQAPLLRKALEHLQTPERFLAEQAQIMQTLELDAKEYYEKQNRWLEKVFI